MACAPEPVIVFDSDDEMQEIVEMNNNNDAVSDKYLAIEQVNCKTTELLSDEENESPLIKRKRKTRRPKGKTVPDNNFLKLKSSIYANTVKDCYKKIDCGFFSENKYENEIIEVGDDNNNNIACDVEKQKVKVLPRRQSSKPINTSPVPSKADVIFCDGSPSPPPSPIVDAMYSPPRRPRQTRKQKQALASLQMLKNIRPQPDYCCSPFFSSDLSFDASSDSSVEVKVRSRTGIEKFPMKQMDTFLSIFQHLASRHEVPIGNCLMFHGDVFIEPYMTLASSNITVADIIDFGLKQPDEIELEFDEDNDSDRSPDMVELQVQAKGLRRKLKFTLLKSESLVKVLIEFAKKQECEVDSLKMYFDGELVDKNLTPEYYEMEDDDCIDMILVL